MSFENPLFKPPPRVTWAAEETPVGERPMEDREAYDFDDDRVVAAVNVALATRRPLLVTGTPGGGKSSLARAVAAAKGWTYVEQTITSRTELADLTAGVDAVRRLADAQVGRLLPDWAYVRPGVLWWAFDPDSAATRGGHDASEIDDPALREAVVAPDDPREVRKDASGVVVLLDEIDKAEPDLPNDLLEPLDRFTFHGPEGQPIDASADVFVVITSNRERRLPPAFLRRCVQLELSPDSPEFFAKVALAHFGERTDSRYLDVAKLFVRYRDEAANRNRRAPSTAEYLDTVRACLTFGDAPGTPNWPAIVESALWKAPDVPELADEPEAGPAA
jgi:MoxR-like ATPase